MRWTDYQAWTLTTAQYPMAGERGPDEIIYLALGLAGETLELGAKLGAIKLDRDAIALEAGDVAWYLARLADVAGWDPSEGFELDSADEGERESIFEAFFQLCKDVGAVSEAIKKAWRKNGRDGVVSLMQQWDAKTSTRQRPSMYTPLREALHALSWVCYELGVPLETVLDRNKAKLEGRRKRGTITGSGDQR